MQIDDENFNSLRFPDNEEKSKKINKLERIDQKNAWNSKSEKELSQSTNLSQKLSEAKETLKHLRKKEEQILHNCNEKSKFVAITFMALDECIKRNDILNIQLYRKGYQDAVRIQQEIEDRSLKIQRKVQKAEENYQCLKSSY